MEKLTNICLDKSKIKRGKKFTTMRTVCEGGGQVPQKGQPGPNVWREEGWVQLGRVEEKGGEKGG
jgi:hypothetical protein